MDSMDAGSAYGAADRADDGSFAAMIYSPERPWARTVGLASRPLLLPSAPAADQWFRPGRGSVPRGRWNPAPVSVPAGPIRGQAAQSVPARPAAPGQPAAPAPSRRPVALRRSSAPTGPSPFPAPGARLRATTPARPSAHRGSGPRRAPGDPGRGRAKGRSRGGLPAVPALRHGRSADGQVPGGEPEDMRRAGRCRSRTPRPACADPEDPQRRSARHRRGPPVRA